MRSELRPVCRVARGETAADVCPGESDDVEAHDLPVRVQQDALVASLIVEARHPDPKSTAANEARLATHEEYLEPHLAALRASRARKDTMKTDCNCHERPEPRADDTDEDRATRKLRKRNAKLFAGTYGVKKPEPVAVHADGADDDSTDEDAAMARLRARSASAWRTR